MLQKINTKSGRNSTGIASDKVKERLSAVSDDVKKIRNERPFMTQMLETAKDIEWDLIPQDAIPYLAVEIYGTEGTGKTHSALTFPDPAILDTEGKAPNVMRKLGLTRWKKANSFIDVIDFINAVIKNDNIKTAVFDSSRDIVDFAEEMALEQLGKTVLYSQAGAVLYTHVNQKLDWIVQTLRGYKKNVVFTSRMKDEYKDNSRTGELLRDGYKKSPYQFDIVIELTTKIEWEGRVAITIDPIAKIVKNGYVKRGESKPYLLNAEYKTIINEIFQPVNPSEYMKSFMAQNRFVFIN